METLTAPKAEVKKDVDFLPLNGTDYVEFFVGNAKQAAHYYQSAFGFEPIAYAGLETGVRDCASYVLQQDKIRLVLTASLHPDSEIAEHVKKHGDGVKVIALWVDDATRAFEETVKRGAKPFVIPKAEKDEFGEVVRSGIHTFGETVHVFVERKNYHGVFLPGYKPYRSLRKTEPVGFRYVDHMVGNVGWNEMNTWVKFYEDVMGFKNILSFDDKDISTEYSALMSKVMSNGNGRIKFPINEPAEGKRNHRWKNILTSTTVRACNISRWPRTTSLKRFRHYVHAAWNSSPCPHRIMIRYLTALGTLMKTWLRFAIWEF